MVNEPTYRTTRTSCGQFELMDLSSQLILEELIYKRRTQRVIFYVYKLTYNGVWAIYEAVTAN